MKFSHSLQFNCVPEWSESYLSYGALKKALYAIERAFAESRSAKPTTVTTSATTQAESAFLSLFDAELERVREFYRRQESWCQAESNKIAGKAATSSDPEALTAASAESLGQHIKTLYVTVSDLKDYLELNRSGFARVVQKYERYVPDAAKKGLLARLDKTLPPFESASLDPIMGQCETIYAVRVLGGSVDAGRAELQSLLRERVLFERSTIWQDMVEMERRVSGVEPVAAEKAKSAAPAPAASTTAKPCHAAHHPTQPVWVRLLKLGACLAVFAAILLKANFTPDQGKVHVGHETILIDKSGYARRAGAVCVLSVMFWCLEVIPLFATAILVPFLATVLDVIPPDYMAHHGYISASALANKTTQAAIEQAIKRESVAKAVFASMFSPSVMLLIGGFSIASALSKHGIAKRLATMVLGRAGRNPAVVLIVIMAITTAASTFISNVAAPVLVFTLVQPLLRALGTEDPLAKSIVLGVAYAANIGGFMSPISSPQNILTSQALDDKGLAGLSAPSWLLASIVCAPLCLLVTFLTLRFFYPASKPIPDVLTVKPNPDAMSRKQWLTVAVSLVGIGALVATDVKAVKSHVGTLGVMAITPLVLFFGFNLLGKEDFNGFMWNVVMIAMGGGAVGSIAQHSGLLESVGSFIQVYLEGRQFFTILIIFSSMMLVMATFVSHSVSSAVMAPLLAQIMIKQFPEDKSKASILVMVTCFVCSVGMGMPISGFPNMTAMSIDDALGRTFVDGGDFAKTGLLASALCTVVLLTAGYGIFSSVLSA
jgi:anion transporter